MGCVSPENGRKVGNSQKRSLFRDKDIVGDLIIRIDTLVLNLSGKLAEKPKNLVLKVIVSNQVEEIRLQKLNELPYNKKILKFVLNSRHIDFKFIVFQLWNIVQGGQTDISFGLYPIDINSIESNLPIQNSCCLNYRYCAGGKIIFSYDFEPRSYEILRLKMPDLVTRMSAEQLKDFSARVIIGEEEYTNKIKEIKENSEIVWEDSEMIFNVPENIRIASYQIIKKIGENMNLQGQTKIDLNKYLTVNSHAEIIEDISLEGKFFGEIRVTSLCSDGKIVPKVKRRFHETSLKCIEDGKQKFQKSTKFDSSSPITQTVIVNSRQIGIQHACPPKDQISPPNKPTIQKNPIPNQLIIPKRKPTLPIIQDEDQSNYKPDILPFKQRSNNKIEKVSAPSDKILKSLNDIRSKRKRSLCVQVL